MLIRNKVFKKLFVLTIIFSLLANPYPVIASAEAEETEQTEMPGNENNEENTDKEADDTASQPEENTDPATLRLVFTSDIHGQLTTADYENGGNDFTSGGYSRAVTLLRKARAEVDANNSLQFDLGDNLYDYTTDYIYNYDQNIVQPIYETLAKMNYDAITLGNHEFDYTLGYLQNQLTKSGLSDKVVLSNVKNAVTKKTVWAENKIITKELKTDSGNTLTVKVGLIGETVPKLSKKRTSYTGILESEDVVENAKKEAAALRAKGADVVVVLAHSGIGGKDPEYMAVNAGYAVSKIEGIDAVLCGHAHKTFPDKDKATIYDYLPGVDLKTGLVNGKPLVQVKNRATNVGIADLKLAMKDGKVTVVGAETDVRKVDENTEIDPEIEAGFGNWANIFITDCSEVLCKIDEDTQFQNYFGALEDTDAIQFLNDIKISFALKYTRSTATEYMKYPVVAASNYIKYGSEDDNDYVNITKNFKRAGIYQLATYRSQIYLYQMTGAQIKEWLEWSASCYEEPGKNVLISPGENPDSPITKVIRYQYDKNLQYALKEEYLNNWDKLYFFDGLEYTIDTTVSPRYDESGNRISDSNRITSLSRNGRMIADGDIFVVSTHALPSNALFSQMNPTKIMRTTPEEYQEYQVNYLKKIAQVGTLGSLTDHNWQLKFSDAYNYLVKSSVQAENLLENRQWLPEVLGTSENAGYYMADFTRRSTEDTEGPCLNAVAVQDDTSRKSVAVTALASDISDLASLQFIRGKYTAKSGVWDTDSVSKLTNGSTFRAVENGIYSILARDGKGNRRIAYVNILNINKNALEVPEVDNYTNRKTYISGKAEPNTTVYFRVENGKLYSSKVNASGRFKYKLAPQVAGSTIYVYVKDKKGRTSARTVVFVKRTGPNKPALDTIKSSSKVVSGRIRDTYAYPMLLVNGTKLYVPNAAVKSYYLKSEFYNTKYSVKICPTKINSDGSFKMTLTKYPPAKSVIQLRTTDVVGRCSLGTKVRCKLVVPNQPTGSSEVTNLSRVVWIYGNQKCSGAGVLIGKKKYYTGSVTYNKTLKKYAYKVKIPRTDSTSVLKAYIKNSKGRSKFLQIRPKEVVPNTPVLYTLKSGSRLIRGKVDMVGAPVKVRLSVSGRKCVAKVEANGKFSVKLKHPLKRRAKIACRAVNSAGSSLIGKAVVQ